MGTLVSLSPTFDFRQTPVHSKLNMKFMIIAALLAVAAAAPQKREALDKVVAIVRSISETNEDGSYYYAFESEDGTKVEERGVPREVEVVIEKTGTYTYVWENVPYTISYSSGTQGHSAAGA